MTTARDKPLCMWVPNELERESKNPSGDCQEPVRPGAGFQNRPEGICQNVPRDCH